MEKYLTGVSYNDFLANSEKRFATIKQIEIIGEACNQITQLFKEAHPKIEWKAIEGMTGRRTFITNLNEESSEIGYAGKHEKDRACPYSDSFRISKRSTDL